MAAMVRQRYATGTRPSPSVTSGTSLSADLARRMRHIGQTATMRRTWRAEEFDLLSPTVMKRWSGFLHEEGDRRWFPNLIGIEVEELRRDYARLSLPSRHDLNEPSGLMHAGVIATLIDTTVVPAIGTAYTDDRPFSTIEMSVRYLQPVRQEDLVAEGWVTRRGKRVVFCEVAVCTASGVLVADGHLIYVVGSPPPPPE